MKHPSRLLRAASREDEGERREGREEHGWPSEERSKKHETRIDVVVEATPQNQQPARSLARGACNGRAIGSTAGWTAGEKATKKATEDARTEMEALPSWPPVADLLRASRLRRCAVAHETTSNAAQEPALPKDVFSQVTISFSAKLVRATDSA